MDERYYSSAAGPRGSVIVRSDNDDYARPSHNDDRLTHGAHGQYHRHHHARQHAEDWCHHAAQDASLEDISYEQLEQRLAQPSEIFQRHSDSLHTPEHHHTALNIDIDDIFQKFSDLVKSNFIPSPAMEHGNNNQKSEQLSEATPDDDTTAPADDKRPVSDCHVCGDRAIAHLHYGGICCYSCKAFFRRAVQSGKDKSYKCKRGDGRCEVSVNTRRGCQRCRFEKCLSVGMTCSWVLSDEQCEIRFGKGKAGSKRKHDDEPDTAEAAHEKQMMFDQYEFSDNDRDMVDHLVKVYEDSWEQFTFSDSNSKLVQEILNSRKEKYSSAEMNSMVTTVIQRGIFGMNNNHHFGQLTGGDRKLLLFKNMSEMCLIRGALRFNVSNKSFMIDLKGSDKPENVTSVNAEIRQDSLRNLYASEDITR